MQFTLNTKTLTEALKTIKAAVATKSVISGLTHVHMKLNLMREELTIRATDLELFAEYTITGVRGTPGEALIDFKALTEALRNTPTEAVAEFKIVPERLVLEIRIPDAAVYSASAILVPEHVPDFPKFPQKLAACPDLPTAMAATAHAVSENRTAPWLMGFWLSRNQVIGCDGSRIACHPCKLAGTPEDRNSLIVPGALAAMAKVLTKPKVAWDDNFFYVDCGALRVATRRTIAQYADVLRLVPDDAKNTTSFTISRAAWLKQFKSLPKHDTISLEFPNESPKVWIKAYTHVTEKVSPGYGKKPEIKTTSKEVVATTFNVINETKVDRAHLSGMGKAIQPLKIGFNAKFLWEAIKAADADEITLCFSGARNPMKLVSGKNAQWVLPLLTF